MNKINSKQHIYFTLHRFEKKLDRTELNNLEVIVKAYNRKRQGIATVK